MLKKHAILIDGGFSIAKLPKKLKMFPAANDNEIKKRRKMSETWRSLLKSLISWEQWAGPRLAQDRNQQVTAIAANYMRLDMLSWR